MNIFVFDIETIPDIEAGRRLYDLDGLSDKDTGKAMFAIRSQETDGHSDFIRLHLQRIVAISAVLQTQDQVKCWSLGEPESDEKDLISKFFTGLERYEPTLVSWNGSGFDLPVLHYRSLLHSVSAPQYWDTGENNRDFKWNNYLSRYHARHTDVMDVLAGYQPRAGAPLDGIASLLGFPGKLGMDGSRVWDYWVEGKVTEIRDYCETDVLNTYLVWLRFELIRGNLGQAEYQGRCRDLRETLSAENRPHFRKFLDAWPDTD